MHEAGWGVKLGRPDFIVGDLGSLGWEDSVRVSEVCLFECIDWKMGSGKWISLPTD